MIKPPIECTYIIKDNIRSVVPYFHEYITYAKGRWLNKEIIEVLNSEYAAHSREYWIKAIEYGNVKVNNKLINVNYKFKNSDIFSHKTHRHEPPISGNIIFVGENEELVAISKPATLPVHACGAYRYNSLMLILKQEPVIENQPNLHLVHRLDRLTSGLMILAKSKESAGKMSKIIQNRETKKTYLARVKGKFPNNLSHIPVLPVNDILTLDNIDDYDEEENDEEKYDNSKKRSIEHISASNSDSDQILGYCFEIINDKKILYLRCPVGVISYRNGVHGCNVPNSKPAVSSFEDLGYCEESDTTLVKCNLHTGRTHQLRLHLQFIGNPIANDPCYGGVLFYNDKEKTKKALDLIQIMRDTGYQPLANILYLNHLDPKITGITNNDDIFTVSTTQPNNDTIVDEVNTEPKTEEEFLIKNCRHCAQNKNLELELSLHCDGIWLHALSYEYKDLWKFETPWPEWALPFVKS